MLTETWNLGFFPTAFSKHNLSNPELGTFNFPYLGSNTTLFLYINQDILDFFLRKWKQQKATWSGYLGQCCKILSRLVLEERSEPCPGDSSQTHHKLEEGCPRKHLTGSLATPPDCWAHFTFLHVSVIKKKQWSHHSVNVMFPSLWVSHLEENGEHKEAWQPRFPSRRWWKAELPWGCISPWDGDICFNCGFIPAQRLRLRKFPSCIRGKAADCQAEHWKCLWCICPGDSSVSTSDLSSRLNQSISGMGGSPSCKTQILRVTNCTGEI